MPEGNLRNGGEKTPEELDQNEHQICSRPAGRPFIFIYHSACSLPRKATGYAQTVSCKEPIYLNYEQTGIG
jgi:hypothetical protein